MFDPDLYLKALQFAAVAHGAQKVPGSEMPYLVHVCTVAAEVIAALEAEAGKDGALAVPCALLHDVVEDTTTVLDHIESVFGERVAAGVDALSKRPALRKEDQMADSLARIQSQPREIWMIKLADRLTNLQTPPSHWTGAKCYKYRLEAELILTTLGDASPFLAARFAQRLTDYERHERERGA